MKEFFNRNSAVYISNGLMTKLKLVKEMYDYKFNRSITIGAVIEALIKQDKEVVDLYNDVLIYVIEINDHDGNLIKVDIRGSLEDARELAQSLEDDDRVETEIYTGDEYSQLHPDRWSKFVVDVFYR